MIEEDKKPFDAGDESEVARRKKNIKRLDTLRLDTLKTIMSTVNGRAWIWWLLGECGVHRISVAATPHLTYFNEGQRNIGLKVFAELHEHCAGDYAKMVNEAQTQEQVNNASS